MSPIRSWTRILLSLAVASTVTTGIVISSTELSALAAGPVDVPWTYGGLGQCDPASSAISPACMTGALADFNRGRAKNGLGPLRLPGNFRSMSVPVQIFTLTNIDRRDRGLPPFVALAPTLSPYTQPAANAHRDPSFPKWARTGDGGNWAGTKNSLWAEYLWVYDDGWRPGGGSTNGDCTSAGSSGCWSHRKNILAVRTAPRIFGASVGSVGVATLMMGGDTHDWNLLTPNAPNNLRAQQVSGRRIQATWTAPAARGTAIRGYDVKRDSGAWIKVTARSWTSGTVTAGAHTISVKSFNARGSSPVRTAKITVN